MARHATLLGTLTIASGQTDSNVIQDPTLAGLVGVVFYNPAAFTGTVSVLVAFDDDALFASHAALYNNGSAVQLTAGRVEKHDVCGFKSIAIQSGSAEGADRNVQVIGIMDL
jgi:hypothetical protein